MNFDSLRNHVIYPLIVAGLLGQFYFSWSVTHSVADISTNQKVMEARIFSMEGQLSTLSTVMVTKDELLETLKRIELFIQNESLKAALMQESKK